MVATVSKPDMLLWLDDHRGRYIPRDFANSFADRAKHVSGVDDFDWTILESGPDHDLYWAIWEEICDNARVTDDSGTEFFLYQDGALWLVPVGMEWNDSTESFDWPDEESDELPDGVCLTFERIVVALLLVEVALILSGVAVSHFARTVGGF